MTGKRRKLLLDRQKADEKAVLDYLESRDDRHDCRNGDTESMRRDEIPEMDSLPYQVALYREQDPGKDKRHPDQDPSFQGEKLQAYCIAMVFRQQVVAD